MKHISLLIKPASSLCNMNCKYCFYADVERNRLNKDLKLMNYETVNKLIDEALKYDNIHFAFQGGEPTLAGLSYFEYFVNTVNKKKTNQKVTYALQTNGILIDKKWIEFFKENHFLVGISLDGIKIVHNKIRVMNGKGTFDDVMRTIKLCQKEQIHYNVLTVISSSLVKYAKDIYKFYKKNNIYNIQFIPCLPELENDSGKYALTPEMYFKFYKDIFEEWYKDIKYNEYISISLFEDLLMIFSGKLPRTCGALGQCTVQYIIESNGDVYPCDFYAIDRYCLGNLMSNTLSSMKNNENAQKFLHEKHPISKLCSNCEFVNICHGNCKRMTPVLFNDHYCGYRAFLNISYKKFYEIAKSINQKYPLKYDIN